MLNEGAPGASEAAEALGPSLVETSGLRSMTRRSALFATGAMAGKVIGLVMLPVLTRLLTPHELGNLDVLMVLTNALIAALLLGLDVAALRLYFDQPTEAAQRTLLSTWYAIGIGVTVSVGLVIVLFSGTIVEALFSSDQLQPAVVAVAVAIVGGTVEVVVLTILRARGRAGWYAVINVGALVLYAVLATTLLTTWRADAAAVIWGWALALAVMAIVGTVMLRHDVLGRPASEASRRLLRLGLPLAPAVVGTLVAEFLVRIILLRSAGADQVAYFSVGNRFASVAALSLVVLQLAWVPRVYAIGSTDGGRARVGGEATWIVALVCGAVLVVAAGASEIVEIAAGSAYLAALPALGFSLLAVIGAAVYLVASMPSALGRRTEDLGLATAAAAVVGVIGTFVLAEAWRAAGTAASMAAGQVAAVVVVGLLGARRTAVHIEWRRILVIALATSVATMVLVSGLPLPVRLVVFVVAVVIIGSSVRVGDGIRVARRALHR